MRLLLYSPTFLPHIGGLEYNIAQLAEGIATVGHEVIVVTKTPGSTKPASRYHVVRSPSRATLLELVRWSNIFFQANVSLRGLWPLLFIRRPWVVSHHGWYSRPDGSRTWQDRLKRFLLRYAAASIAVSEAIAADLETPCVVIANAYRDGLFRLLPGVERRHDLLFVGRLVSDKGVDLLIEALAVLARRGLHPPLTIVGEGPDRERLEEQARSLDLGMQVLFLGARVGEELVRIMNSHQVLVVPSRYNEPFGIVALEGLACGCDVVASKGGGLSEAVGPCGTTFRNGDVDDLAAALAAVWSKPPMRGDALSQQVAAHLETHRASTVVARYLKVLNGVTPNLSLQRTSPRHSPGFGR